MHHTLTTNKSFSYDKGEFSTFLVACNSRQGRCFPADTLGPRCTYFFSEQLKAEWLEATQQKEIEGKYFFKKDNLIMKSKCRETRVEKSKHQSKHTIQTSMFLNVRSRMSVTEGENESKIGGCIRSCSVVTINSWKCNLAILYQNQNRENKSCAKTMSCITLQLLLKDLNTDVTRK